MKRANTNTCMHINGTKASIANMRPIVSQTWSTEYRSYPTARHHCYCSTMSCSDRPMVTSPLVYTAATSPRIPPKDPCTHIGARPVPTHRPYPPTPFGPCYPSLHWHRWLCTWQIVGPRGFHSCAMWPHPFGQSAGLDYTERSGEHIYTCREREGGYLFRYLCNANQTHDMYLTRQKL